jgi:hypothetical protein
MGNQVIGPAQPLDNTYVVQVDNPTIEPYQMDKSNHVILSASGADMSCILPANPNAGESHRFVVLFTGRIFLLPNTNTNQVIIFNPNGVGPARSTASGGVPFVPAASQAELVWNGQGAWVASCCVQNNGGGG